MSEVVVELPPDMAEKGIDQETLKEALEALAQKKAAKAKARDRRAQMTEEEKQAAALRSKKSRARLNLMANWAEKQGYKPTDAEVDAYLAAQEA